MTATEAPSPPLRQRIAFYGRQTTDNLKDRLRSDSSDCLLPRAEAALRQELQRLADAAKRAREGQSASSSGSRAL